jgi:DNA-directed RNA polymerase subunit RPC12/RpoP
MRYLWSCTNCGQIVEVDRPMAEIEVGPDQQCHKCGKREWKRGLWPVPFIGPKFKGGERHGADLGSK